MSRFSSCHVDARRDDQTDVFEVTDLTAITGSITDNVGFTYKLQCRESGMDEWPAMDEGSGVSVTGRIPAPSSTAG